MREYGQIQCAFWEHAGEEGWSNDAMLLGAYLLTGPHSNGIGTFRIPAGYIQDDLGWDRERVSATLSELSQKGFCNCFGKVVHIPKFLRWNPVANANVAKAREKEFEALPGDEAKGAAAPSLLRFGNHWDKGFINRLETLSKRYGKQDPTQPDPTHKEDSPDGECGSPVGEPPSDAGDRSLKLNGSARTADQTPYQEIINLYRSCCASLPDVIKLTPARKQAIRARCKSELPTLADWEKFFKVVEMSDFLTGRAEPSGGRSKPFLADLDFLTKQGNCVKVMEGKYDD